MRNIIVAVLAFTGLGLLHSADSKTETALRKQLVASEAARTALAAQIKSGASAGVKATQSAENSASRSAANAEVDAAYTVEVIALAAETARLQAIESRNTTIITSVGVICAQLLVLIGILAGFIHTALMSARNHSWVVEEAKKASDIITKLEKNTNSIKDALVKTTGEKAYAEGLLDGKKARA